MRGREIPAGRKWKNSNSLKSNDAMTPRSGDQGKCLNTLLFTCSSSSPVSQTPRWLPWRSFLPVRRSWPPDSPSPPVAQVDRLTRFLSPDVGNTSMLLLSFDKDTLFVGARDAVISLDVSQPGAMEMKRKLDWIPSSKDLDDCSMKGKNMTDCPNFIRVLQFLNSTHLYTCGTFAFSPRCTYIDLQTFTSAHGPSGKPDEGRGRCPSDGELYAGTVADYQGNRPVISRYLSQGSRLDLKLDDTLGWLEDPTFISSAFIPAQKKVYFFFSEEGREYDFIEKFTVSRIAQVCTSDVGGQRTLQRRWTTFAKAQLLCQAEHELPYNVLQDIITLPPPEGATDDETLFYGIFTSQWSVNSGRSAVCAFRLGDIRAVFSGNYKVLNRDTLRWSTRLQEKVANPGECGLHNASDNTLRFVKENFLADDSVLPVGRGLALVSPDQRYSKVAAQRTRGANGRDYTVLFLLAESGFLHKAVLLAQGPHVIEEVQVFQQPQPVKNLLLSVSKGVAFVGTSEGVLRVPVANCSHYWSCAECVLARDPFCAWDPARQACADVSSIPVGAGQDVEGANVMETCEVITPKDKFGQHRPPTVPCPPGEQVPVSLNEVVTLRCPEVSKRASLHWERPSGQLSPDLYLQLADSSLHFLATPATLGHYLCVSEESGYRQTLAVYVVKERSGGGGATTQTAAPTRPAGQPTSKGAGLGAEPSSKTASPKPTAVWGVEAPTAPTTARNLTAVKRPQLTGGGTLAPLGKGGRSYLGELVAVSVMLALSLCVILAGALYGLWQRCRGRSTPQVCPRRDSEAGSSQEQDPLTRNSPRAAGTAKQNDLQHSKAPVVKNGSPRGSNGHLPNTPI
ncbi:hypothetical protein AAFF_G00294320 [Aldrovandia affinis]|uniref:Sema domain-containing protein n=1 Tax=Aldrovandia affinis TaxID=143900 RepID=A0AAD7R9Q0_9TELE|nr:hypothetical protein AAFF_G00294320 [Aldrovandia affinis]